MDETGTSVRALGDADALRSHLDALNEAGVDYQAVGVDAHSKPFLITLTGPYGESEAVLLGSPWDGDVDYGTGTHCEECNASNLHGIEALRFPVQVFDRLPAKATP